MTELQVVDLGNFPVDEATPVVAGPRGQDGADGADGTDGASAYEVAVANGFVGTEAEWLASLAAEGGGGAVESVNDQTGAVILDAADVGAETPAGAQSKVDTHAADTTSVHGIADTSALATTADVSTASTADRARANHTGTQSSATIADFTEAVQDAVAALLASGTNVTLTYDDPGNTLTVSAAGADAETMRDTIGAALVGVGNVAVTVNDAADTITISTTATVNSTDAALRDRSTHSGTQSADTLTDGTTNKAFLATERTKLAGVATGATANDTDANLKNRANHTGSQAAVTISDLTETVQDLVAAMVVAGTNVTKTYDDTAGTLTLAASGGGGGGTTPALRARTSGFAATGSSFSVTIPATAQVGDLLVLMIGSNNTLLNEPAGWALAQSPTTAPWQSAAILTRLCQAGDPGSSFTYTASTGTEGGVWYCFAVSGANRILDIGAIQIGPGGTAATTISAPIGGWDSSARTWVMATSRQTSGAVVLTGGTAVEVRSDTTLRSGLFTPATNLPQQVTVTAPGSPGMGLTYLKVTS